MSTPGSAAALRVLLLARSAGEWVTYDGNRSRGGGYAPSRERLPSDATHSLARRARIRRARIFCPARQSGAAELRYELHWCVTQLSGDPR